MRFASSAVCLLILSPAAACYDPADAGGGTASSAEGSSSGATDGTTVTTTASTTASTTATTTATTSATTTATDVTTDEPTTSAGPGSDTDPTGNDSSSSGGTTGEIVGCLDGLFVDDAPPLGDAVLVASLFNGQGIELVDVDDDGDLDLLVSDFGDGGGVNQAGVWYLAGDGAGGFAAPVKLPGGDTPAVRLAAAPIADDTVDVVAMVAVLPNYDLAVRRWRGNGDGTFLAPTNYADAADWDVALYDLDGDGRRDLLGTRSEGARVSIATAAEGFGAPSDYGGLATVNAIRGGDVDGDGDGDILSASQGQLQLLRGDGAGGFGAVETFALPGSAPIDVMIADFDGDGIMDLGTTWDAIVAVLEGDGAGGFGAASELTVQGSTLAATTPDFDGDGCSDIAVFNNTGSVSTIMGRDDFGFTDQHVFNIVPEGYPYDIASGDVDGDQIADIAVVTAGGGPESGGEIFVLRSGA